MDKISIIVPCYNEEESIFHFYEETARVLDQMQDVDHELLFVDDGSKDKTIDMLRKLCDKDARCRYLSFSRNFGKEAAMYAGLSEATGNYCVIMDADLQHPPKLLPQMYQAVSKEGFDCCGGKRIGREGDGFLRSFCSRLFYKVGKSLTHMDMGDGYGDFRMMNEVDSVRERGAGERHQQVELKEPFILCHGRDFCIFHRSAQIGGSRRRVVAFRGNGILACQFDSADIHARRAVTV